MLLSGAVLDRVSADLLVDSDDDTDLTDEEAEELEASEVSKILTFTSAHTAALMSSVCQLTLSVAFNPFSKNCHSCSVSALLQARFMDAVVKVYCVHSEPNYYLPWQRKRQFASTSSGFIVASGKDRPYLLTNAHSVEYHSQVRSWSCEPTAPCTPACL